MLGGAGDGQEGGGHGEGRLVQRVELRDLLQRATMSGNGKSTASSSHSFRIAASRTVTSGTSSWSRNREPRSKSPG